MTENAKPVESWAEFWGGNHSIYVNARHMQVHYTRLAADLTALLADRERPKVLDWGCGDAFGAPTVAESCGDLLLYDAVPAVQARLAHRFAGRSGIRVLDSGEWTAMAPASLDVIIVVSVLQYLSRDILEKVLDDFRRVIRPGGEIIFGDVIPPHVGMVTDIGALLTPAARHGFFLAACVGLVQTFFSDYRKIREKAGFSCYEEADFVALLRRHGFAAERQAHNIGFNQGRMTFRVRPV